MTTSNHDRTGVYFVGPFVDSLVIGGASLLAYVVLWSTQSRLSMEAVNATSAMLLVAVNWPHFSATVHRLYHSTSNIYQYPLTAIAVPLVILGGVWASFAEPAAVAPYFVKLYLIWSPYHFSGQTLGITLLYARRAGVRFSRLERSALAGFIFATFVFPLVRFETGRGDQAYFGVAYPALGIPAWTRLAAGTWLAICAVAFIAVFIRWKRHGRALPPAIVFLPAVAQFVWFVPGSRLSAFNEFVPLLLRLQYLLIAWALQLKEKLDVQAIKPSRRYVFWETTRWLSLNVIGGMLLFKTLPLIFESTGAPAAFVTGVILAAVQIHHFFVDGVIWKLKSPAVSSPLMVNLNELVGTSSRAPATATQ
jgi:hypothetical protein